MLTKACDNQTFSFREIQMNMGPNQTSTNGADLHKAEISSMRLKTCKCDDVVGEVDQSGPAGLMSEVKGIVRTIHRTQAVEHRCHFQRKTRYHRDGAKAFC